MLMPVVEITIRHIITLYINWFIHLNVIWLNCVSLANIGLMAFKRSRPHIITMAIRCRQSTIACALKFCRSKHRSMQSLFTLQLNSNVEMLIAYQGNDHSH